jgi:hypothetical protein
MQVNFTPEQYKLVNRLLSEHYDQITTAWEVRDDDKIRRAYGAVIAMRVPLAEEAWKEYSQSHNDPLWRYYETKEEFFKDQYTIYPEDLVTV